MDKLTHLGRDKPYIGKEDDFQKAAARLWAYKYPSANIFHVPNGGARSKREGAKFKLMGVKAGVSDIVCLTPSKGYNCLIIELKAKEGKLRKSQKDFLLKAQSQGAKVVVAWNMRAVEDTLDWYFDESKKGKGVAAIIDASPL